MDIFIQPRIECTPFSPKNREFIKEFSFLRVLKATVWSKSIKSILFLVWRLNIWKISIHNQVYEIQYHIYIIYNNSQVQDSMNRLMSQLYWRWVVSTTLTAQCNLHEISTCPHFKCWWWWDWSNRKRKRGERRVGWESWDSNLMLSEGENHRENRSLARLPPLLLQFSLLTVTMSRLNCRHFVSNCFVDSEVLVPCPYLLIRTVFRIVSFI